MGCSDGHRLKWIKEQSYSVLGIEPGEQAIEAGIEQYGLSPEELKQGDAYSFFETNENMFDIICFAHCLYLIDPVEIPLVIGKSIESLRKNGLIIIYDFHSLPQQQTYHHLPSVTSYKADFSKYFTWLPTMKLIEQTVVSHDGSESIGSPKEDCALSIIKKIDVNYAFPSIEGQIKTK